MLRLRRPSKGIVYQTFVTDKQAQRFHSSHSSGSSPHTARKYEGQDTSYDFSTAEDAKRKDFKLCITTLVQNNTTDSSSALSPLSAARQRETILIALRLPVHERRSMGWSG